MSKNHLIIQTAYLGDLLLSVPMLKRAREIFSGDNLYLFCRKGFGKVFVDLGLVDQVIEIDKKSGSWSVALQELRSRNYENIISAHQSFRTATIVWRLNANFKVGYSSWYTNWAYHKSLVRKSEWPDGLRQLDLLRFFDKKLILELDELFSQNTFKFGQDIQTKIPDWASASIRKRVLKAVPSVDVISEDSSPIICLAPGSVWPTKRWTSTGFEAVANQLIRDGFRVLLTGSPAEIDICHEIAQRVPEVKNLCGKLSLLETLRLFADAQLLICNDSGAQHMAALVDTPVVAIFGPTTLDLGYRAWVSPYRVAQLELPCRPCGTHGGNKCPIGTHDCMKKLDAKIVLDAAHSILK